MWHSKPLLLAMSLCILASSPCTVAAVGKPLVTAITKDASTSLYTAPLKDGRPLVLDLSGPIIWSTCDHSHSTLECHHFDCAHAHSYHPPNCPHTGYGKPDDENRFRCKCTSHPHNPCSGKTATGDLTRATLSANTTDGKNPLRRQSFPVTASCAPESLLAKLPAGAVGVAGLARSLVALPAQVARTQKVADKLALCLPSDGKTTTGNSVGVAIFGGGPLFFVPPERGDFTTMLAGTVPLHGYPGSPGYYISAAGIAVDQKKVPLSGPLVVGLSTTAPYTALRPDVYGPFVKAFDQAAAGPNFVDLVSRVAAVAPFERCYNSTKLSIGLSRLGYPVPQIDLLLEGGQTFMVLGANSMVQVNADTACLGFVRMKAAGGQAPAAIIGGFQLENHLLVLDDEKKTFGFTTFLGAIGLSCSNFNFTLAA